MLYNIFGIAVKRSKITRYAELLFGLKRNISLGMVQLCSQKTFTVLS